MALIKKQLLAKEDILLSADNTPVSQARAGTTVSVHPVNASVIPFDGTRSIVEAVEDLAYTHPLTHPVSIIDGSSNPSKFVKTDTLGNTGFDNVTWAEIEGKPGTYTPSSHEHSLDEVTSGTLPASRIAISETRQFITAEQASQLLDMEIKSNKGIPNGYAPLDSNGKINSSFLSDLNLVEVFTPADLASMLALTSAQPGDIAYRQDNSTSYMLVALPASTEANWKSLNTGSQVISVNGQTGVVSLNTSNIAESTNLYFTNERVDDRVANLLQAGTNISLTYNDALNTLTINANDTSVNWSEVQSKPTTISGYGITDSYTKTETDSALSLKAPLTSPTFAGTVALPSTTSIGNVSNTELGYLDGVTSSIQTQFNGKVSKTGDETIAGVKTFSSNPISSATQSTAVNALTRKDYVDGLDSANVKLTGDETIAGVKTLADGLKLQGQNVTPFSGFKNYIINGNFNVWQRGTSFTGLTNTSYSADRWVVYDTTGDINYNVIRTAGIFTGGYGARYTWNSGTGTRTIHHFIENVTRFKVGSSVTVSFEAYTNSTPYSIGVAIQGARGNWTSSTLVVSSPIALTNTKTKYSVTLSVPDWSSIGIDWAHLEDTKLVLRFDFGANTNGKDFIIGNVQLEEGSVATPFEQRPYGLELSLCQRYFYHFINPDALYRILSTTKMTTIPFPVSMRTAPTIIPYKLEKDGTPQTENSGAIIVQISNEGVLFIVDAFTSIVDVMYFSASAEL